jgi:SPP1 family predicted phage head-tail adaptor
MEGLRVKAGSIRHRVTFQRETTIGADAFGSPVLAWADLYSCWSEVRGISAKESAIAGTIGQADAAYTLTIRDPGPELRPTARDRAHLPDMGKTLNITGTIDGEGRRREVRLTCAESRR